MASDDDEPGSSCFEHGVESQGAKRRRVGKVPPKHDIFLSHSGQEKAFVEQLYHDLLRMNQRPFFDQDSVALPKAEKFASKILEAAEQCRVAVVVVSEGYLTSKWPMLELSKFVEHKRKLFPLFFKLSPADLKENEVETRWKQIWRQLVEKGEVKEEVMELWSAAVKELRSSNGLEYGKFGNSEYKFGRAAVEEICKAAPPILEWSSDGIQGSDRLCAMTLSMFESKVVGRGENVYKCLGLHGMGGVGKTTLCKAMCSYCQGKFGGRVLYVELPSDQATGRIVKEECLSRLKSVIQQFASFDKSISDSFSAEEQGWQCLKAGLENQAAVFLAIDNVGDFESSREEARRYLNAGLPSGSKVLVTARSREILKSVLGQVDCCKPIPRLEWVEAATLFLSKAAPNISSVSCLKPEEKEIVDKCLSECQFKDVGYLSSQYHPLVLRALGTYFHDVDSDNMMGWKDALENKNKLQRSREARNVNDILGLNYHSLSEQVKLVFLDCALYSDKYEYCWNHLWWCKGEGKGEGNKLNLWVSWISKVHGVSPSEAKMMVKELQRLCLVEDSHSEVSMHDLYMEFARVLVETEGSKEWQWWMSDSSNVTQLKRLFLYMDKCRITSRSPRRFVECRSLVFLELWRCGDVGPDLELGSFNSLRVLYVLECNNVKRVVCSCNNGVGDGMYCYKRNPGRGCLSELVTVNLDDMQSLEGVPFLRHCWNLQWFEMSNFNGTFPAISRDPEIGEPIDFGYLKALRTFSVDGGRAMLGCECDVFVRWLLNGLQLSDLIAFEYRSNREGGHVGGYTIDLNEAVQLSPRLSVLSLQLPREIEEVKGLHLLSELTTLNLSWCAGLRRLPDLQWVPKLKWICVRGCCKLDNPRCLPAGVQGISAEFVSGYHDSNSFPHEHSKCLDQFCHNEEDNPCPICDPELNYNSLSDKVKLVFLDSALYYPDSGQWCDSPWWSRRERNKLDMWVSWISEVHGVSPCDAKMMVEELQSVSLLKKSDSEVLIRDNIYKEFAMDLVEDEDSQEWQWRMSDSSNVTQLKRLFLYMDKCRITSRSPRRFVECRSLVFLELMCCYDVGPDLELGSFNSLRVLYVLECENVKRVVCSCKSGEGDGMYCYKRNPGRGCMSELVTVKLVCMEALEDVPFLRHCWNLQWFEMSVFSETFPSINGDPEVGEPIDFGYLKALRTFSVDGGRAMLGCECDVFVRWLLNGLQLSDLIAFEYRSNREGGHVGGYTIDLNEAVQLSPRLSVLSLQLPREIEEVKGLHLLSELTTLNLSFSRGIRRLPDLQWVPKLKWICVRGCCKLDNPRCLPAGVQGISAEFSGVHDPFCVHEHSECLDQYCYGDSGDDGFQCSICDPELNYNSLSDKVKLVFLDFTLYYPDFGQWCDRPWWSVRERNKLDMWVSWISEVHGVSPSEAKMMVEELQSLSIRRKESDSEVLFRDMYTELAMDLVKGEGSKEWEWTSESSNATQLNRLLLKADVSRFSGRISKRFVEGRNLVFLELVDCEEVGPDLELGSFNSLRVLYMTRCHNVTRVVCSCINGDGERVYCYRKNPARGCMSELMTVKLKNVESLEDLSFLRHCWNLQWFEMSNDLINPTFPAINGGFEREDPIDFGYLKALRTFSVIGGRAMLGYDCDAFIKWLLNALQLRDLTAFEYESDVEGGVGGYTIDLNEAVQLSPRLSVLSVRLPGEIEEVKGLHLLSELTILNLNFSLGLRRLPDLQWVPKLRWVCVHGCFKLGDPLRLRPGTQAISAGFGSDHTPFACEEHSECLDQSCFNADEGDDCSACMMLMEEKFEFVYKDGSQGCQLSDGEGREM